MKKHDAWAIAAALLLENDNSSLHYRDLATEIVATGLTTLGEKSYSADQTIGSILRSKKTDGAEVFSSAGDGYYDLAEPDVLGDNFDVSNALHDLRHRREVLAARKQGAVRIEELERENATLRAQVGELTQRLDQIRELCQPTRKAKSA